MEVVNGRPAKSYESVVVGGADQEIAETIFKQGPAGIQAFGNTNKTVIDDNGTPQSVGFSRPSGKYIWIKIECSENKEEQLSPNWPTEITENIVEWSGINLGVAVDLIYQKLFKPIYDVQGIGTADIKLAVTDDLDTPSPSDYISANIPIGEVEIALVDPSRIEITEMPNPAPAPGA
jgi:hypothetical protein